MPQLDTFDQLKVWLETKGLKAENLLDIISEEQSFNPYGFANRCIKSFLTHLVRDLIFLMRRSQVSDGCQ
jgi:hypothetical protein